MTTTTMTTTKRATWNALVSTPAKEAVAAIKASNPGLRVAAVPTGAAAPAAVDVSVFFDPSTGKVTVVAKQLHSAVPYVDLPPPPPPPPPPPELEREQEPDLSDSFPVTIAPAALTTTAPHVTAVGNPISY